MRFLALLLTCLISFPIAANAAEREEDLTFFRTEIFEKDNSYSGAARVEANAMLEALEREAADLSEAAYELRLTEIVAKADNGHTLFFTGFWRNKFNRIPIQTIVLENRLYVGGADEEHADLVGAEITHIDGAAWQEVRRSLGRYQGGVPQWKLEFIRFFLESPAIMHAAGVSQNPDRISFSGVLANGDEFQMEIEGQRLPSDYEGRGLYVPPSRLIELAGEENERPLYLRAGDALYRFERLQGDVAYIQFKTNSGDYGDYNATTFSEDVLRKLKDRRPHHVILDQRFNSGGDLNYTRDLMQTLPKLVEDQGKVFVITSGKTFSAGISSVGYLKQVGGDRVVIVGEPVGDRLEFWAEGPVVELPQSGAAVLYATERHNYASGCSEDDCHKAIVDHPIKVERLDPDYLTPMTYADFTAGRDPAMEKIMALIEAGK